MSKRSRKKLENKIRKELSIDNTKSNGVLLLEDVIRIYIEIWRIKKRIGKSENGLSEQLVKRIDFSYEKIQGIILRYNIELNDIQGEKYFEDMNGIEIISAETDENSINQIVIKEMIEPIVMMDGKLYKKGKVIIGNK